MNSIFTSIHHVGLTVPNLEQALEFFTDVLGFELVSKHGPFASSAEGSVQDWFDVEDTGVAYYAFVGLNGQTIELLEWRGTQPNPHIAKNSDYSGRHLAIAVSDLEQAIRHLEQVPGVRLMKPRGQSFVYAQTPWGLYLQLIAVQR